MFKRCYHQKTEATCHHSVAKYQAARAEHTAYLVHAAQDVSLAWSGGLLLLDYNCWRFMLSSCLRGRLLSDGHCSLHVAQ